MKKNKLAIIVFTVLMLTSMTSTAGWYVGGGVAKTSIALENHNISSTSTTIRDFTDDSYKFLVGWTYTPSLALEFGYNQLGNYKQTFTEGINNSTSDFSARALFGGLVGLMKLGDGWSFVGKLGLAYWDAKMHYRNSVPFENTASNTGIDPVFGLGFQYKMPKQPLAVRLEWEQYQNIGNGVSFKRSAGLTNTLNGQNISNFGVTLGYYF